MPTALKGTVSHNAPIVHVEKEIHTVNQPVHVEKPYNVPYDVIKHVEKIIEVPTPVHVSVPVPVEVPHPVLGKNFVVLKIIITVTQCSKIRKKVQFQKCKKALFAFSKMARNQLLHQKKV